MSHTSILHSCSQENLALMKVTRNADEVHDCHDCNSCHES